MDFKISKILKSELIKTSFFTSIATFVKIVTAFVLNKVVAIYIGPVGVALIGQFNNFFGIVTTISTGGINNGVVKHIAEDRESKTNSQKVISTAFILVLICSLIAGTILFIFSGYFSNLIFKSYEYKFVLVIISVSILFASLNSLLMSILNGHKEVKKYTYANIITSLFILALSVSLVIKYNLKGVLIALVLAQSLVFFITLGFVLKCNWFKIDYFFKYFDKIILQKLSKYSIMTLVSSVTGPAALLIIRNHIGNTLSWKEAGYWQGVWTISEVYLMFITSSLGVYYLPRLAEIKTSGELRHEILNTSKIILPVVSVMALLIFLLKEPLMYILFTGEFKPMLPLFKFQLLGDVIKIASWLLAYQMVAKAMIKLFIFTEVLFSTSLVIFSILFLKYFGLEGICIAFSFNFMLYFIFLLLYFRRLLSPNE
jgi:polysaccharide transporter, PST family